MSFVPIDGNVKVTFVPTIASITAPTAATEMVAMGAADLQDHLTPDGLNINLTEDTKDVTTLASTFNTSEPGRASGTITLTYFRDTVSGSDKAYTTLKRFVRGYLVVRRGTAQGTAWAASDKAEVYPVQCGLQKPVAPAKNTDSQVTQDLNITSDWSIDSVLAT